MVIGGTYKTLCAHHILPFFGRFIIGYIPEKMIIGASKIPRIVEVHMRRLQSQEHLAHDVADTIEKILEPRGIAVWMGGIHMCMVMRGVEQESSFMETNVLRGEFLERRADAAGVHVHREPARVARSEPRPRRRTREARPRPPHVSTRPSLILAASTVFVMGAALGYMAARARHWHEHGWTGVMYLPGDHAAAGEAAALARLSGHDPVAGGPADGSCLPATTCSRHERDPARRREAAAPRSTTRRGAATVVTYRDPARGRRCWTCRCGSSRRCAARS